MSNCVLLDEYRHNLSAALGHLPGDEGDLEEEEEAEEEEEGDGNEERARTDLCENEEKKEEEKEKEEKEEEKEKRDLSEEKAEKIVKLLENGLTENDLVQEYKGGFDRIMDSENGANMSE